MKDKISSSDIAKMIDHSLLHPTLTEQQLRDGCKLAATYHTASVCVKPCHVTIARDCLAASDVLVGAVIGFPHGNNTIALKVAETEQVIRDGAVEVDMVINIAKAIEEDWDFIRQEIGAIVKVTKTNNAALKIIFATDYMNDKQIIKLCEICAELRVDFVKTSTGYNYVKDKNGKYDYEGASEHVMELMRKHSPDYVQVKAAGKVRGLERYLQLYRMGVSRVGTASTRQIVEEARQKLDGVKETLSTATPTDPAGY